MNDIEEILAKHGYTKEQVISWAKEKGYGMFIQNFSLVAKLFLIHHGVRLMVPKKIVGEVKKISELAVNETAVIRAVVVQQVDRRDYIGCPNCYRKLSDAQVGKETLCPKCGQLVKPKLLSWQSYLVGDESGEIVADFPPSVPQPETGVIYKMRGALDENDVFRVFDLAVAKEEEKPAPPIVEKEVKPPVSTTAEVAETKVEVEVPETKAKEFRCEYCGKTFSNEHALKIHIGLAHKKETEKVEAKETKEVGQTSLLPAEKAPSERPPEVEAEVIEKRTNAAAKFISAAALIKMPVNTLREQVAKQFPGVNFEEAMKRAGVKVVDGRVVKG